MLHFCVGIGVSWMSETVLQLDIRCEYTASLTVGRPGAALNKLMVDSLALLPDHTTMKAFTQTGDY